MNTLNKINAGGALQKSKESAGTGIIQIKRAGKTGSKITKKYDIMGFAKKLGKQIVNICVLFAIGGTVLYSSRVAQSNILPICRNKQPFTGTSATIRETTVDFNSIEVSNEDGDTDMQKSKSTKIVFPIEENMSMMNKNRVFHFLKVMTNPNNHNSNSVSYFLGTLFKIAIQYHFLMTTKIYNFVNESLPEWAIVVTSPFIYLIALFVVPVYNMFNIIQQWFFNLSLLNSTKTAKMIYMNPEKSKKWQSDPLYFFSMDSIMPIWTSVIMLFTGVLPILAITIGILIGILFSLIPYTTFIKSEYATDRTKQYGVFGAIKDLFKNKFWLFSYLISMYIIVDAKEFFGMYGAVVSVLVCFFLYMFTTIYDTNHTNPSALLTSGIAGSQQQTRNCSSFMDWFTFVYDLFTCKSDITPDKTAVAK